MPPRTDAELEELAEHVCFEIVTLVEQVELLVERFGPSGPEGSMTDTEGQAMLEASLVHLRLLDDFLGDCRKHPDDLHANDWVPGWGARSWLDPSVRKRIDWHVAHLSARRVDDWEGWDLPAYVRACCDELGRFFGEITDDRLRAFYGIPEFVASTRSKFAE